MSKLLLVDDDAVVRYGLRTSIPWEDYGIEAVFEAANGEQGLQVFREKKPDIVLTDIKMPVRDGLWLCREIAALNPDVPMIIMSGYEDFDYARQAVHLGVREYIVKPVDADLLTETLARVARENSAEREAEPAVLRELQLRRETLSPATLRAVEYVRANYMRPVTVRTVAAALYLSESHLSHQFKADTNYNFIEFLNRYRIDCSKALLLHPDLKLMDIAEMVGYQNYKHFHTNFVRFTGQTPRRYQAAALNGESEAREP